jgi:hypothetical protein
VADRVAAEQDRFLARDERVDRTGDRPGDGERREERERGDAPRRPRGRALGVHVGDE